MSFFGDRLVGRGAPGYKARFEIPAKWRPHTSPKLAQFIVSSVIRPDRLSQHLLISC